MRKIKLSIAITAHNEGLIAHKTMKSVFAALEKIEKNSYEIIINVDNGSDETKKYFKRYENDSRVRVFQNKFGDVGSSRNFCASVANGKYLSFIDADDLISDNWFVDSLKILEKSKKPIFLHPEALLSFGLDMKIPVCWPQHNFNSKKDAIYHLFHSNQWSSAVIGETAVFLKFPYIKNEKGYGHEDYFFILETYDAGYTHKTTPKTTCFYRQKTVSLLKQNNAKGVTQPYCALFDLNYFKNNFKDPNSEILSFERRAKDALKATYIKARNTKLLNFFMKPFVELAKKMTKYRVSKGFLELPEFVVEHWKEINKIENQLYPHDWMIRDIAVYNSLNSGVVTDAYVKMAHQVPYFPDYVFVVPWMKAGGADKVVINYCRAMKENQPEAKIAVITTVDVENEWQNKLPDNAFLINFGFATKFFGETEKDFLFARLLTQLKCKKIQIVNSEYAYRWVIRHKELIEQNYELNVSFFCHDVIKNGSNIDGVFSYADPFLLEIYPIVNKIFTDNRAVVDEFLEHNGLQSDEKFKVHYQPVEDEILPARVFEKDEFEKRPVRILWASRVAAQKRPDLLKEIAKKINADKYIIDMYGNMGDFYHERDFRDIASLKYRGGFRDIDQIDFSKYDVFLYNSAIDGVPNILLEVAAKGLPIISSNVGGIGELIIDGKTGFLVKNTDNVNEYVQKIKEFAENPEIANSYVKNVQEIILERHRFEHFEKIVKADIKL